MSLLECGEGGYKWGESGVCFTGPNAKELAIAVGRAIKAADNGLVLDQSTSKIKPTIDDVTGFMTAPVTLSRIGVQHYFGFELGLVDRATEKIGVFRPEIEVFDAESIKSFINLVATDNHPEDLVTTSNVKSLQVGTVSDVKPSNDNRVLEGVVTITDQTQINKIKNGKIEVSVGYLNELKEETGSFDGQTYEFIQTKIRANHLAIVDNGRCGPNCKIITDGNEEVVKMQKVTIDGITFDIEDGKLAQAISNMRANFDTEKAEMLKKLNKQKEDLDAEIANLKASKDALEGERDAAKKQVLSDDAVSKLVSDQLSLVIEAKEILGDKMPECLNCPKEIKTAVVDKVLDLGDLSAKSNDYIQAVYDMALKYHKNKSLNNLSNDFASNSTGKEVTRDSARNAYVQNLENPSS
jgi:hypothetical protein